ncbi:MAG: helix-turn-helix transcriptional regulator [Nostoc sp. TH1S01]|nr:helix-turn-helix transcriptional regulator [Nostoc sp. TH1S01]
MIIQDSHLLHLTKTSAQQSVKSQHLQNFPLRLGQQADFLQEVLESLEDGILIISKTGKILHANAAAHDICFELNQDKPNANFLPSTIWYLCQSLLNSQSQVPDKLMVLSDEIVLDKSTAFRIRVRLLNLDMLQSPCFLVIIENRYESLKNAAIAEVKKYDLTPREAEIWFLYRSNYSYKEIADKLYITINTVKKHMKSIHAKRQAFLTIQC